MLVGVPCLYWFEVVIKSEPGLLLVAAAKQCIAGFISLKTNHMLVVPADDGNSL